MKRLVIFASGSGTNAENIARLFHQGNHIRVAAVFCNRKSAGVYERMQRLDVPVVYVPNSVWDNEPAKVVEMLKEYAPDLIVLAGFMRAIKPEIIDAYPGKIVNIHPSLLPKYGGKGMYGHHVHEAVIANKETRSGVTVHYVTAEIDGGEIVMQQEVEITPEDTPETLEAKIHPVEYALYPRAIVAALGDNTPKTKSVDEAWAEKLHLNYSDREARERKEQVEQRARQAKAAPSIPQLPQPGTGATPVQPMSTPGNTAGQPYPQEPEKPKSHLLAAILVTILCCTLAGVVAIVYGSSVSSRLAMGDYQGAMKASKRAEGWIIAGFVLGLISSTIYFPIMLFTGMM